MSSYIFVAILEAEICKANSSMALLLVIVPESSASFPTQVKALVEWRGTDVNRRDYDGRTALLIAASEGRLDVVQYLGVLSLVFSYCESFIVPKPGSGHGICICARVHMPRATGTRSDDEWKGARLDGA